MRISQHLAFRYDLQCKIDYLDELVQMYERFKVLAKDGCIDGAVLCDPFASGIHVYQGIDILAKAVGETLHIVQQDDLVYKYKKYFDYCDVRFFELSAEV